MIDIYSSKLFGMDGTTIPMQDAEIIMTKANSLEKKLTESITAHSFVKETVGKIDGKNVHTTKKGETKRGLSQLKAEVEALLKLKDFQTRLNEAQNLVQNKRESLNSMTLEDYCELKGITLEELQTFEEYEEANNAEEPIELKELEKVKTEDVICSLDVKTRSRMLTLSATSAAVGSCIHPTGAFATAREELMTSLSAHCELSPVGSMAVITSSVPSVKIEDVDKVFFELQALHRELEAENNRIQSNLQDKIHKETLSRIDERAKKLEKNKQIIQNNQQLLDTYTAEIEAPFYQKIDQLESKMESWRIEELSRLDQLRFVVPDEMISTLEDINRI